MSDLDNLIHRDVPKEIEAKVMEFAKLHKTFTTKDLFEKYPNNPEFMLRYALNNLRLDKSIYMFGNKRGAFYSTSPNIEQGEIKNEAIVEKEIIKKGNIETIKTQIMQQSNKFTEWFKRTDLNIDMPIPEILNALKELELENKLTIRGIARWTEYHFDKVDKSIENKITETTTTISSNADLKSKIYSYIKKQKVVTVPMLIEELNLQRHVIIPYIDELVQEEEIWHEGIKKGSKYIHKDVPSNEVEKILDKLNEERKIEESIDELSEFLISECDATCIGVGIGKNEKFEIKMMKNGVVVYKQEYESFNDGFNKIREMTTVSDG